MNCNRCGAELSPGLEHCPNCGTPQGAPPSPEHMPPPFMPQDIYGDGSHPYQQIGGWLRVIQVLMIISLASLGFSLISSLWGLVTGGGFRAFAVTLLNTALGTAGLIPTVQLLQRNPKFLRSYHIIFLVLLGMTFVTMPFPTLNGMEELMAYIDRTLGEPAVSTFMYVVIMAFEVIFSLVSFLVYRLYYTRSVRVRTYLGTDAYITQCPFTKGVTPPLPAVPDAQTQNSGDPLNYEL